MKEHSAGGVVINDYKILLLKKFYGDWVLPKGKIETDETTALTAIREVSEETGINAEVIKKVGYARYYYFYKSEKISKRVDYYLMSYSGGELKPQREEGFSLAEFVEYDRALEILKHNSEKQMVINAMKFYEEIKNQDVIFKRD